MFIQHRHPVSHESSQGALFREEFLGILSQLVVIPARETSLEVLDGPCCAPLIEFLLVCHTDLREERDDLFGLLALFEKSVDCLNGSNITSLSVLV